MIVSPYSTLVLSHNPVAYWPLDNALGSTTVTSEVGGYVGTVAGAVTFGVTGPIAGTPAVNFGDDQSGWITVPNNAGWAAWGTGPATMEMWAKAPSTGGSQQYCIDCKQAGSAGAGLQLFKDSRFYGRIGNGTEQITAMQTAPFTGDVWHHVVLTLERATPNYASLYMDGKLEAGPTAMPADGWNVSSGLPLNFARYNGDTAPFTNSYQGSLAHVALYRTALTQDQIRQHYYARNHEVNGEIITVGATAVGPTQIFLDSGITGYREAKSALFTCEGANVTFRIDGTNPTANTGHLFTAGSSLEIKGLSNLKRLKFIRTGSDNATVTASYYR